MSKVLVTRYGERILSALYEDGKILELSLESDEKGPLVGDIYLAQVKSVAKNINAAFVDMGEGQMGYLPLEKGEPMLADDSKRLAEGSVVLVQLAKEAVKTKAPVMSSELSFPGSGIVLVYPKEEISFSSKIQDKKWKEEVKEALSPCLPEHTGLIIRTNGREYSIEQLKREVEKKTSILLDILKIYRYRACFSRLHRGIPGYGNALLGHGADKKTEEIITDDPGLYEELKRLDEKEDGIFSGKLRFYEDPLLSMKKMYRLEFCLERALKSQVWLKSGGYLVIQPTEALTVIDVNTGKNEGHKKKSETIWLTNREAAKEIAFQMRLRNLSGIIIVDFIDMEEKEKKKELLLFLADCVKTDPVKTDVVDMTALNLVEITRKRVRKPLHEQIKA